MKIRKAIIPAAGLGTRFLPATKAQPKEMLPIVDKPAIQYIVEEAVASGIEDVIIVTGRNKRAIEDHFDKSIELERVLEAKPSYELLRVVQEVSNLVDVYYVRQKEPLGLGHAVYTARKFIGDEPFALLLGDDIIQSDPPCLKRMIEIYEQKEASVIGVQEVPWSDVDKYGIVSLGSDGYIEDLVEKPELGTAPSNLAVIGRYIIEPQIFDILERQEPGRGGEIQLTDALRVLNRERPMTTYKQEGRRFDVGDKLGYIEATIEMALARPDLGPAVREYIRDLASKL
ncbi:UTP--glucose-1-phosphate uridylyltransferase GalU [Gorillibacterium sp. CAU 1737]|uniref:UTP--glucose-1-phosphate uridylyltransferase GalU n=1 Tax=Gorillibacterium sp. CAU 1737 TaxID=3140362 RepID=UPI003260F9F2